METNKIIAIGDTHGDFGFLHRLNSQYKDSTFIHVGDVGIGYYKPARDKEILENFGTALEVNGNTAKFIRGNHDCPSWFDDRAYGGLQLLRDNQVFKIKDKDFLFIGGAISIDRSYSILKGPILGREFWWEEEEVKVDLRQLKNMKMSMS